MSSYFVIKHILNEIFSLQTQPPPMLTINEHPNENLQCIVFGKFRLLLLLYTIYYYIYIRRYKIEDKLR